MLKKVISHLKLKLKKPAETVLDVCSAGLTNDPHVKGHVIVTLYAVIMFKGHVSSYL